MKTAFAIAAMLMLAGCTTNQERCGGYGWAPGTGGFAQCMQSLDMQDRAFMGNYLIMQSAYRRY